MKTVAARGLRPRSRRANAALMGSPYIAPFSRDNLWKKYNLVVKANITQYVTIET